MSLPSLATILDFENRYSSSVPALDVGRIETLLADASALVREAAGRDWPSGARVDVSVASNTNSITCAADPQDTDLKVGDTLEIRTRATGVVVATKVITTMTETSISWQWGNVSVTTAESVYLPVPGMVVIVCCEAVRRAYDNPQGLTGETVGNYSWRGSVAGGSVYLTADEQRAIRKLVHQRGAFSVDTYGEVGYLGQTEDEDWTL